MYPKRIATIEYCKNSSAVTQVVIQQVNRPLTAPIIEKNMTEKSLTSISILTSGLFASESPLCWLRHASCSVMDFTASSRSVIILFFISSSRTFC
jgi:hypothetical protein